jgi:hypothetical protein
MLIGIELCNILVYLFGGTVWGTLDAVFGLSQRIQVDTSTRGILRQKQQNKNIILDFCYCLPKQ